MATSPYDDTVFILDFLGRLVWDRDVSVLDVGAGFGRWGFLLRCHLGFGKSLTRLRPQKLRIDAIEAFEGNVSPIYDCVYDRTFKGDAQDVIAGLGQYDVVICSHVIEHFEKDAGMRFLDALNAHADMAVILALPFGEWPQEVFDDNEYEVHRATWMPGDFAQCQPYIKRFGRSGVVIVPRNAEARWQVRMLSSPLRRMAFRIWRGAMGCRKARQRDV
jgi:SAM-dependent methyltransferase